VTSLRRQETGESRTMHSLTPLESAVRFSGTRFIHKVRVRTDYPIYNLAAGECSSVTNSTFDTPPNRQPLKGLSVLYAIRFRRAYKQNLMPEETEVYTDSISARKTDLTDRQQPTHDD
jgi:hypothetical protein